MEAEYDAIIIGAGVSGLAAGGVLSRAGYRVLMLEKHAVVGGCCSTFRRAKFIFDAAVHAIGGWQAGDIVYDWFAQLGVEQEIQFHKLDPFYCVSVGQEQILLPANLDELAQSLSDLSPCDSDAVRALVEDIKTQGQRSLDDALGNSTDSTFTLGRLGRLTWAEYLAGRFQSSQLEVLLYALTFYAGLEPERVSALFMISMFYSYHRGAYYPVGSTQRFVDTMANAIRRWGGTIRRRANVQRILFNEQGRACGVGLANGEEFTSRLVISCADITKTLGAWTDQEHLSSSLLRRLKRQELSPTAIVLYLAVREEDWSLPAHETFYLPTWTTDATTSYYCHPDQEDDRPWFSLCAPSLDDHTLAPAGHHALSLMGIADAAEVEAIREQRGKTFLEQRMLAHSERLVPGLTRNIIYRELATARTIERYTNNNQGSIYGWAKDNVHWLSGIRAQEILAGLYVAGHWTRGIHGVYGSFLSGLTTAQTIVNAERDPLATFTGFSEVKRD